MLHVSARPRAYRAFPFPKATPGVSALALDVASLVGVLALIVAGLLVRLSSVIISDMDEGTYIYAGKLLAQGQIPYRDFLLTHPPVVVLFTGAIVWLFGPDTMVVRYAYMAVIIGAMVPLYMLTRHLSRSHLAGLLSVAIYTAGMVLIANMGRTVRLEPMMNAFLIGAVACYVLRPGSPRIRFLLGMLIAGAILVKLVAIIFSVCLLMECGAGRIA